MQTNLYVKKDRAAILHELEISWPSIVLNHRQLCDLELLLDGSFSPLDGFLGKDDYLSVLETMRLTNGTLWPIPIVLDINETLARSLNPHDHLVLKDEEGAALAVLHITDVWESDKNREAEMIFETTSTEHPYVHNLFNKMENWYVGGKLEGLYPPQHFDYRKLRLTPQQVQNTFTEKGWEEIIAFQTRNPIHKAHFHMTLEAMKYHDAHLLIHPIVGETAPGDFDYYTRVRCYQKVLDYYPQNRVILSLLPLAMRMAGPREAVWHGLIRKNYGCTGIIIGRNHASPSNHFYGPYKAQELFSKHEEEIGIKMISFSNMVFDKSVQIYIPESQVKDKKDIAFISGSELRNRLLNDKPIPEWFSFNEVSHELKRGYPPRHDQGITIFFTGLSSSGKSTIANLLKVRLFERGRKQITLLDGDILRRYISPELGFSKEDRDMNIRRIGFIASLITSNRGICICAPIAPYNAARKEVRELIEEHGDFILVHLSTPLEICEMRDRKDLYAKAREGTIKNFTGISDPFEPPEDAEITIDTTDIRPDEAVAMIIDYLRSHDLLPPK